MKKLLQYPNVPPPMATKCMLLLQLLIVVAAVNDGAINKNWV